MSDVETISVKECEHRLVHASVFSAGTVAGQVALWSCDFCGVRFYPACPICVDVGHRNVVHPLSSPETTPAPDDGLRAAARTVVAEWDALMHVAIEDGEQGVLFPADTVNLADAILPLRAALRAALSSTPAGVLPDITPIPGFEDMRSAMDMFTPEERVDLFDQLERLARERRAGEFEAGKLRLP